MSVNLTQPDDGSLRMVGVDGGEGGWLTVNIPYNASSVDYTAFVADRSYSVVSISGRPDAAGTDSSAVTAQVVTAASGTAVASGTALHTGTYNLKGTAATNQSLTVASNTTVSAGGSIGVNFTGTLTSATGVISVVLAPR